MSMVDKFTSLVKETFEIKELNDKLTPEDIDMWDSITHMDLCAKFEEEFDISLDVEDIAEMESIGQMKEILQRYGVEV